MGGDTAEHSDQPADPPADTPGLRARVAELEGAVERLEQENARLAKEVAVLEQRFADLSKMLAFAQVNAQAAAEDRDRLRAENNRLASRLAPSPGPVAVTGPPCDPDSEDAT